MFGQPVFRAERLVAMLAVCFCTLPGISPAEAKPLYVNGMTGDDSTTWAENGPAAPWRSIGRALWGSSNRNAPNPDEAARAGDVVQIACGLYETTGTNTNGFEGIALSPVNNGTAAQPIRIQAAGNQTACIQVRFTSGHGSVIGSYHKSYIQWSGFDLDETNTPWDESPGGIGAQTAQVWISGEEDGTTAVGNRVENSRFRGTATMARDGDNYTAIRLHGTTGTTIRNVQFSEFGLTDENTAGVLWYYSTDVTIENSLFERCGAGVYMKGQTVPSRIGFYHFRRNRFVDNFVGIYAFSSANASAASPGIIAQNIFSGGNHGVKLQNWVPTVETNPNDLKFVNNLFVGQSADGYAVEIRGDLVPDAGMLFQNNIIVGGGSYAYASEGTDISTASFDPSRLFTNHNIYKNISPERFVGLGVLVSFSEWQGTYGQDGASQITEATLFSDADYHLAAGSPALNHGRAIHGVGGATGTTINAGPYITGTEAIGLLTGPLAAPTAPTNLRITGPNP